MIEPERIVSLEQMLQGVCDDDSRKKAIEYLHTYQYDNALTILQNVVGSIQ